jgi:hypothetical protein
MRHLQALTSSTLVREMATVLWDDYKNYLIGTVIYAACILLLLLATCCMTCMVLSRETRERD